MTSRITAFRAAVLVLAVAGCEVPFTLSGPEKDASQALSSDAGPSDAGAPDAQVEPPDGATEPADAGMESSDGSTDPGDAGIDPLDGSTAPSDAAADGGEGPPDAGTVPSVVSVAPASGSLLAAGTPVVVTFDATLEPASLQLAGTMAAAATASWSAGSLSNDTLTLTAGSWPDGAGTLTIDASTPAGAPLATLALSYYVDALLPTATSSPLSGARIRPDLALAVTFSESMLPSSLRLTGALAGTAVWSTAGRPDDTLTITPAPAWAEGAQSLGLEATDLAGNALVPLMLDYVVDATAPAVVEVVPPSGSLLAKNGTIQVTFSESIETSSLTMSGTLAGAAEPTWSAATEPGDRVVLGTGAGWPEGSANTLRIDATDRVGNPLSSLDLTYRVDSVAPTATGTLVVQESRETVELQFSESMDPATLVLGGSLAAETGSVEWSAQANPNDTLRILAPDHGWQDGTINIDAEDTAGNALDQYSVQASIAVEAGLPLITVPVQAIRLANDDGTRATHVTLAEIEQYVQALNRAFAPAAVRFTFNATAPTPADYREVNSTLLNQMEGSLDAQWDAERTAANAEAHQHPGRLTLLFHWGASATPSSNGFSWTNYDFVVMPGLQDSTLCGHPYLDALPLLVGHHLGLWRTFRTGFDSLSSAEIAFAGDPLVFDGDGLSETAPDPFINTYDQVCNQNVVSQTVEGTPFPLPRDTALSWYDHPAKTITPQQAWLIRQGALLQSGQGVVNLVGGDATLLEVESLVGAAVASCAPGCSPSEQPGMVAGYDFHGRWSGDSHLFWGASGPGATLTVTFDVPAGTYRVLVGATLAPDFGRMRFRLNADPWSAAVDYYAPAVGHAVPLDLGMHSLGASNQIVVEVEGRHPSSMQHYFGFDYLLFVR